MKSANRWRTCIAILGASLACGLANAQPATPAGARPPVYWQVLDFPPYYIVSGAQQGQGLSDQLLRDVQKLLPEFEHHNEPSAPLRQTAQMKAGKPACTASMLRTPEREQFMDFALHPFTWQLPQVLLMPASSPLAKKLQRDSEGRISLADALQIADFHLGVTARRSFGAELDPLLARARAARPDAVREFRQDSLLAEALRLMKLGRFDATLGYPTEAEYLRQNEPALVSDLLYLPLRETAGLLAQYFGCSRHPDARHLLELMNAREADLAPARRHVRDAYTERLPAALRSHYLKLRAELE
ncbi:transporter substrate-binding domain-containing protein [Paucibacter sp. APW11]|uniref:Transporter substrate-binding domain-containing protein n=1 Tax=Roseateles aquae TaxID=3077235 RepID=A0ABU3PAQ0_9BURK|nr:transporter substrate-binding domain-containing protein [Paucibacter sp. APW11]MDT8999661.1 transporter substrate-binding domain-containing protein [Paucibacter sp. APW11]